MLAQYFKNMNESNPINRAGTHVNHIKMDKAAPEGDEANYAATA